MTESGVRRAGHPSASRRTGQVTGRADRPDPRTGPYRGRRQRSTTTRGCATWSPASPSRPPISGRAETSAAQAVSRWDAARTGARRRLGVAGRRRRSTAGLRRAGDPAGVRATNTVWPRSRRWCAIWMTRDGWRSRCAAGWYGGAGSSELRSEAQTRICCRHRVAVQRRAVPRLDAGSGRRARPAAVRPRRRDGTAPPAGAFGAAVRHLSECGRICTRRAATSSSRSSAAGCTPNTRTTRPSGSSPTATAAICCRSPACAGCCSRSGCGSAGISWCRGATPPVWSNGFGCAGRAGRERFERP